MQNSTINRRHTIKVNENIQQVLLLLPHCQAAKKYSEN